MFNIFNVSNFNQKVKLLGKFTGCEIRSLIDFVCTPHWIVWLGESDLTSLGLIILSGKIETVDNWGISVNLKVDNTFM